MKNPLQSDTSQGMGLLLARVPLGAVLLLAGYMTFHVGGLNRFVEDHLSQVPDYMPSWFGGVYLHAIPFAELGLGALLIVGLLTRFSGLLTTLMLVSFGLVHGGAQGFVNLTPDDASKLLLPPTVYATFALITFFAGPGRLSLDHLLWGRKAS